MPRRYLVGHHGCRPCREAPPSSVRAALGKAPLSVSNTAIPVLDWSTPIAYAMVILHSYHSLQGRGIFRGWLPTTSLRASKARPKPTTLRFAASRGTSMMVRRRRPEPHVPTTSLTHCAVLCARVRQRHLGRRFHALPRCLRSQRSPVRALDSFEAFGADFISAGWPWGCLAGPPPNTAVWTRRSTDNAVLLHRPGGGPAEAATLTSALRAFSQTTWAIAGKTSGSFNGFPRRSGFQRSTPSSVTLAP